MRVYLECDHCGATFWSNETPHYHCTVCGDWMDGYDLCVSCWKRHPTSTTVQHIVRYPEHSFTLRSDPADSGWKGLHPSTLARIDSPQHDEKAITFTAASTLHAGPVLPAQSSSSSDSNNRNMHPVTEFTSHLALSARAVVKLFYSHAGGGIALGSGVMITDRLLLTNEHVLPPLPITIAGHHIDQLFSDACAVFNFTDEKSAEHAPRCRLKADDCYIYNSQLDYAIVALDPTDSRLCSPFVPFMSFSSVLAGASTAADMTRSLLRSNLCYHPVAYTASREMVKKAKTSPSQPLELLSIQHPDGRPQQLAICHASVCQPTDMRKVWFTGATAGGSSGSPLFSRDWDVVAIHCGEARAERVGGNVSNTMVKEQTVAIAIHKIKDGLWMSAVMDDVLEQMLRMLHRSTSQQYILLRKALEHIPKLIDILGAKEAALAVSEV